jgi:hypothetical protein
MKTKNFFLRIKGFLLGNFGYFRTCLLVKSKKFCFRKVQGIEKVQCVQYTEYSFILVYITELEKFFCLFR